MRCPIVYLLFFIFLYLDCADQELPEITITIPSDGSIVSGVATVLLIAEDNVEVDSVALFIDDTFARNYRERPFLYSWDTHVLQDSSNHLLYALAYDDKANEGISDTVSVMVYNGPVLFADDFESYVPGHQLSPIWTEIWAGVLESTYVSQSEPHEGVKSYHSYGYAAYVRTDGVGIDITGQSQLIYECAVMVPAESDNGALIGFFTRLNSQTGEIYNGVMFYPEDHQVHVRGVSPVVTAFTWSNNVWYNIQVELDLVQAHMDVWIDTLLIAQDIVMADSTLMDTFAISTVYGWEGSVYYDEVRISQE